MSRQSSIYSDYDENVRYYDGGGPYRSNGLGESPFRSRQHSSSRPSGLGMLLECEFTPPASHNSRRPSLAARCAREMGSSYGESYNSPSDRYGSSFRRPAGPPRSVPGGSSTDRYGSDRLARDAADRYGGSSDRYGSSLGSYGMPSSSSDLYDSSFRNYGMQFGSSDRYGSSSRYGQPEPYTSSGSRSRRPSTSGPSHGMPLSSRERSPESSRRPSLYRSSSRRKSRSGTTSSSDGARRWARDTGRYY